MRKYLKSILAGLALLAAAGATTAHAQVTFSIGLPLPVFVAPAPIYYPAPVYYPPAVVYAPAPRAYYPAPVYYAPRVVYTQPVYRQNYRGHHGHHRNWR